MFTVRSPRGTLQAMRIIKRYPRAGALHVALDEVCAAPSAGHAAVVASVRTECLLLRFHVYKVCFFVF